MATKPPTAHPAHLGSPRTTLRIHAMAINWPARIARLPSHNRQAMTAFTALPYRHSRKSPMVFSECARAISHSLGPSNVASTNVPMLAEPTHHHAERPKRKPSPVAPTVDPAPRLAARNVVKINPALKLRPATRKSEADRTRRPM